MDKLVLIDGNSLVNRAFYALPPLNNKEGVPSQAVYGFTTMLLKIISDIKPKFIAVAFDLPKPTFRHLKYSGYKATRKKMPEELAVQMPLLKTMLGKMGIAILEKEGFEADDIIGTMAKKNSTMTYIVTGDRDSLQLIDDTTTVYLTKRGITEIQIVDETELKKTFMLTPSQVIEYKALAGDSSDNIPGVAGVGEKTALTLLNDYSDLDGVYKNLEKIKGKLNERLTENKDMAYLSKELATIDVNVDIDYDINKCAYAFPFNNEVREYFSFMGFNTLLKKTEIFDDVKSQPVNAFKQKQIVEIKIIETLDELGKIVNKAEKLAIFIGESIHLALTEDVEYVVNLQYSLIDNGLNYNECIKTLSPILKNNKVTKLVYDAKSMKKSLIKDKSEMLNYIDVKLAQYLVDMTINYNTVTEMLVSYNIDEREIATGLMYMMDSLNLNLEDLKMHQLYFDVELPLVEVLFKMEQAGFNVDTSLLNEYGKKYTSILEELTKQIYNLADATFNINSPKQLAKVLFEDMKIPYPKKTTSYSTGAEILEQLALDYEIIPVILQYRFVSKLNSTYIEGLRKMIDSSGIVHTEFKQMLTTTGRLSSVEPNLQNIPVREEEGKLLRGLFIASEGRTLVSADYSQIELRLMAHFSMDETMVEAYNNNEDIHTTTAAQVFGVNKDDVTSKMRRDAKAVNFGIIYGISDFGLAQNLKISRYKAKEYIEKYFERFPKIHLFMDKAVADAKKAGYAITLLGRKRKIPELYSPNYNVRQFGERVAMNMPLQGSAADIIKIAMINVDKALEGMKSKLILQVHDELIIDADNSELEVVKKLLEQNMSGAIKLNVPLTVEVGFGKSWLDC